MQCPTAPPPLCQEDRWRSRSRMEWRSRSAIRIMTKLGEGRRRTGTNKWGSPFACPGGELSFESAEWLSRCMPGVQERKSFALLASYVMLKLHARTRARAVHSSVCTIVLFPFLPSFFPLFPSLVPLTQSPFQLEYLASSCFTPFGRYWHFHRSRRRSEG